MTPQDKARTARMGWTAILAVLDLPEEASFEEAHLRLAAAKQGLVAAVQFILIGCGLAEDALEATGVYDIRNELPRLHQIFAAAGGSTHR